MLAFICTLIKILQDGQAIWWRGAQHWQQFVALQRRCSKAGLSSKALRQHVSCIYIYIYIIFSLLDLVRVQPSKQGFAAWNDFQPMRVCSLKQLLFVIVLCTILINQSWISFWLAIYYDMNVCNFYRSANNQHVI